MKIFVGAIPRKDGSMSVFEALMLAIAFATLVLKITENKKNNRRL